MTPPETKMYFIFQRVEKVKEELRECRGAYWRKDSSLDEEREVLQGVTWKERGKEEGKSEPVKCPLLLEFSLR